MDWLTFISAIVQSIVKLAWPAAIFGAVWIFRDRIEDLLPRLRLKYKDFDVSFRFEQAEKEAAELPILPASQAQPTPEERSRFQLTAEISPRAAILETRTELESLLREVIKEVTPQRITAIPERPLSFVQMVRILRDQNMIDPGTSALLDDLRVIGNNAAHNSEAVFTKDEAFRFRELTDKAMNGVLAGALAPSKSR
jgi:Domain of unknown function (DUF4145)